MNRNQTLLPRLAAVVAAGGAGALLATAQTLSFANLWEIETGVRDYVTTGTTERGVAVNPATGHVLLVSRAGGIRVMILDGETGDELGELDTSIVSGGTFGANLIDVADDGVIYMGNLAAAPATSPFRIYRWGDESDTVAQVYEGDPGLGNRIGDSFTVRGAGTSTQIAAGTSASASTVRFAVFTTTDGTNFAGRGFSPTGVGAGEMQKGICFGPGDSVLGKANPSGQVRHCSFNMTSGASSLLRSIPLPGGLNPIKLDLVNNVLAGMDYSTHKLLIYDASNLAAPVQIATFDSAGPPTPNGNGTGAVDIYGDKILSLDTQSGLIAVRMTVSATVEPPTISVHPANTGVLEGWQASFTVGATGTKPLTFEWYQGESLIADATNAVLVVRNVTAAVAGPYHAKVKNSAGEATSNEATLTVLPVVKSEHLTPLWKLGPGAKPWLATDNSQRGLAYNPNNGHVLVVSRSLGHNVYVLDGANGTELHSLDVSGVELVGTFYLNLVGAAEDGAVFACNLTTSGIATEFVIYRWENDDAATVATVAYRGDPGAGTDFRWGDTFVVRGRGENTQLLAASRNRTVVALFTTTEGANFTATLIDTADATAGNFGLGLAFGGGDSFWGKATGQSLRHVGFDLTAGTGTTLHDYGTTVFPTFISAIAVDPPNGLLAALAFQTPDNTHLYDVSDLTAGPVLLDQEFFAADNENANGTGAGAFGGDRLFMLDSNNGLAAFTVKKTVTPPAQPVLSGAKVEGGLLKFDLTGESGRTYLLQATTDFATWSDLDSYPAAAPKLSISVPLGPQPYRFFRAKVQ